MAGRNRKAKVMTVGRLIEALKRWPLKRRVVLADSWAPRLMTTVALEPYIGESGRQVTLYPAGFDAAHKSETPWRLIQLIGEHRPGEVFVLGEPTDVVGEHDGEGKKG